MDNATPVSVEEIRQLAKRPGWSKARLAKAAGLHSNSLRDLDNEDWNPRLSTLEAVSAVVRAERDAEPVSGEAA